MDIFFVGTSLACLYSRKIVVQKIRPTAMIKTNNTTNIKNISKYLLTTTLTLGLLSATNTVIEVTTLSAIHI
jgi:hypothetical protein